MYVCFRDHKQLAKNIGSVGGINYSTVLLPSLDCFAKENKLLAKSDRALLHFSADELAELKKNWSSTKITLPWVIFLVVSKGGKSYLATAKHEKWVRTNDESIAYVFYARNQEYILEGNSTTAIGALQAFYKMSKTDAENILNENLLDVKNESLQKLFTVPELEILVALYLLCQGYLIVHAKQGHDEMIPKSLRQTFLKFKNIAASLDAVNGHSYWNVFGEKSFMALSDAMSVEWKALEGKGDFTAVSKLISEITSGDTITELQTVTDAYLAIQTKLGVECAD